VNHAAASSVEGFPGESSGVLVEELFFFLSFSILKFSLFFSFFIFYYYFFFFFFLFLFFCFLADL
jgi:hypothetical protein